MVFTRVSWLSCLLATVQANPNFERRDSIEMSISSAFQASPKNEYGRLDAKVAGLIAQRYFSQQHIDLASDSLSASLNAASNGGRGLSTSDLVTALETLEQGIAAGEFRTSPVEASQCDSIMSELEVKLQAPIVSPERLFNVVSQIAPRNIPDQLQTKLRAIAEENQGEVSLHSEAFSEWLRYALPTDCPFPGNADSDVAEHRLKDYVGAGAWQSAPMHTLFIDWLVNSYMTYSSTVDRMVETIDERSLQEVVRVGVFALIGFAMLRAAIAKVYVASETLQKPQGDTFKKPATGLKKE